MQKSLDNSIYFIENFVKVRTEEGDDPIKLNEFQKMFLSHLIQLKSSNIQYGRIKHRGRY